MEVRREQLEGWRRALEGRRRRSGAKGEAEEGETEEGGGSLQAAIYRTMEETDSLLLGLLKRNSAANSRVGLMLGVAVVVAFVATYNSEIKFYLPVIP